MKKSFFICLISLSYLSSSALCMQTDLLIRAQDDETEGGLKLRVSIRKEIQDGPVGDNIEIITEESQSAILDNEGNFLKYNVDNNYNIAPIIDLKTKGLKSGTGKWPPTTAEVILTKGRTKKNKMLNVHSYNSSKNAYIVVDNNFQSEVFSSNILEQNRAQLLFLEVNDSKGSPTTFKSVDEMPFFDAVSTFGTVWTVFDMYEKDINTLQNINAIKNWNQKGKVRVFPHMTQKQFENLYPRKLYPKFKYQDLISNAFYDYRPRDIEGKHVLCFFPIENSPNYTSQSFDVVAHETGHNVLNILRPDLWGSPSSDIKAFHESFGDITALFSVLNFPKLRKKVLEKTKGNLHFSSFLSVIGEDIVDRNATECTKIAILPSCEEHDLSEKLTRALYGILADLFNMKRFKNFEPIQPEDLEPLLENVGKSFRLAYLETVLTSNLDSFIDFGVGLRSKGEPLFQQLVHINFLRHGIDLTDILLSPQICTWEREKSFQPKQKQLECVTGKLYVQEDSEFESSSFTDSFSIFNHSTSDN